MNAIEIRGLTKSFRGLYALDGLNMTVPVGSIYGFIGENGSGKSTTMKLLCGHLVPDKGKIKLFGKKHTNAGVRARVGTLIGGAVSGLPFTMDGFNAATLVLCLITKLLLMAVFVPIYVVMSVITKHRSWMSILLCLMTGMFMFMMIPMLTPLNANLMHVLLCSAGAVGFTIGMGAVSNTILKKTSLV